jgi:hypothetical protein
VHGADDVLGRSGDCGDRSEHEAMILRDFQGVDTTLSNLGPSCHCAVFTEDGLQRWVDGRFADESAS